MSIFIIDYMKLNPEVKTMYDKLEEPRRFAIGMYEDAMRGEKKFKEYKQQEKMPNANGKYCSISKTKERKKQSLE